jgi:uncharacterized membrane protein
MKNLEISSNKRLVTIPKRIILALAIISFIGFLDATYIVAKHYLGEIPPCGLTGECEAVLTSQYATVFNIPVALGGVIYYLFIFILLIAYLDTKNNRLIFIISSIILIGFLASLWFVYLQLFVIKAICIYCIISALICTILFFIGLFMLNLQKLNNKV